MKIIAHFRAILGLTLLLAANLIGSAQKPELIIHSGHSSAVENVWLSPDENILVSQSVEKLVFWDVKSQRILREVTNVKDFFISPNNKYTGKSHPNASNIAIISKGGERQKVRAVSSVGSQIERRPPESNPAAFLRVRAALRLRSCKSGSRHDACRVL